MSMRRRSKATLISLDGGQVPAHRCQRGHLGDVGDVRGRVRLQVGRCLDDVVGADHPADPPAGHRVGLGDAVDHDAAVGEVGHEDRHGGELRVAVDQMLVDLVRDDPEAVLKGPFTDRLDLGGRVHGAGGVGGGHEDEHLGALGAGRLQLRDGGPVTGRLVRHARRRGRRRPVGSTRGRWSSTAPAAAPRRRDRGGSRRRCRGPACRRWSPGPGWLRPKAPSRGASWRRSPP